MTECAPLVLDCTSKIRHAACYEPTSDTWVRWLHVSMLGKHSHFAPSIGCLSGRAALLPVETSHFSWRSPDKRDTQCHWCKERGTIPICERCITLAQAGFAKLVRPADNLFQNDAESSASHENTMWVGATDRTSVMIGAVSVHAGNRTVTPPRDHWLTCLH